MHANGSAKKIHITKADVTILEKARGLGMNCTGFAIVCNEPGLSAIATKLIDQVDLLLDFMKTKCDMPKVQKQLELEAAGQASTQV